MVRTAVDSLLKRLSGLIKPIDLQYLPVFIWEVEEPWTEKSSHRGLAKAVMAFHILLAALPPQTFFTGTCVAGLYT